MYLLSKPRKRCAVCCTNWASRESGTCCNLAQASAYHGRQGQIDTLEALLQQALEQDACFTLRQLAVNGRDLLEQGYRGREVGAALQFMLDAVIDGTLPNEKQTLLKVLSTEFASNATE